MRLERPSRVMSGAKPVEIAMEDPVDLLAGEIRALQRKYPPETVRTEGSPWQEIDQAINRAGHDANQLLGRTSIGRLPESDRLGLAGYIKDMDEQQTRPEWQKTAAHIVELFRRQWSSGE